MGTAPHDETATQPKAETSNPTDPTHTPINCVGHWADVQREDWLPEDKNRTDCASMQHWKVTQEAKYNGDVCAIPLRSGWESRNGQDTLCIPHKPRGSSPGSRKGGY